MPLYPSLAALSQTPASNAADGTTDAPSTIDNQTNLLASFLAQLRDGVGFTMGIAYIGQCLLTKSGANLVLTPFRGNGLTIDGTVRTIPSAGVSLAPTALTPSTNYYIYAYWSGSAIVLEASTTGRATNTTTGVEQKSGDATRTLVGLTRVITGPAWSDTDAARFVISWFNRRPRRIYTTNGSAPSSTSSTPAGLAPAMEFVTWGDHIPASFIAGVTNISANAISSTGLGLNSVTVFSHTPSNYQTYAASSNGGASGGTVFVPGEGYQYISLNGSAGGGTTTWAAGLEASGVIQG